MDFLTLWHDSMSIEWWKMLLIGSFFLVLNAVLLLAEWYMRRAHICEYGYPKRKRKALRKILSAYSPIQQFLLIPIVRNAEKKGVYLFLSLICHAICVIGFVACCVGLIGCMVTLADGWALILLIAPELVCLFVTTAILFIPDLICLPSERKRYKR